MESRAQSNMRLRLMDIGGCESQDTRRSKCLGASGQCMENNNGCKTENGNVVERGTISTSGLSCDSTILSRD